jgi:signal transduction histidine kinase
MQTTVEYGSYIIDITDAMMEHKQGLTNDQYDQIAVMHRRAVDFVTEFLQAEASHLEEFRRFLSHDAMSPITIVIGYSELLLMGASGDLQGPYHEAVTNIRECAYAIKSDIEELHQAIREFLRQNKVS